MSGLWEIDRSSVLSFQKCPRDRYLSRHFAGTGIQKKAKHLALSFGSAFHEGAGILLMGGLVDDAVDIAARYLDDAFANSGIEGEDEKFTSYSIAEQKAIAEGLIRAWWSHDGERFLREFEVIEVEQEGRATLQPAMIGGVDVGAEAGGGSYPIKQDEMILMFRPDALVRERSTGDLYIVSWKTCSTFGSYTINQCNTDMQSMSEVWGVQQSYGRNNQAIHNTLSAALGDQPQDMSVKIEGVLYIFAVKGKRQLDEWLGHYVQNTPLAYGWVRKGPTPEDDEWCWTYSYKTGELNEKTGKEVTTKLGKGWRKVPIWSDYPGGVKQWIDDLSAQRITPRHINCLDSIFPQSLPVSRRADEIESWKQQVVAQESRIRQHVSLVENVEQNIAHSAEQPEEFKAVLDEFFPQHTARCFDYMHKCQFYEVCWAPANAASPLTSGLYQIRVPNHPSEKGAEDE